MSVLQVRVRELAGWGIDVNPYRPQDNALSQSIEEAKASASALAPFVQVDPRVSEIPGEVADALAIESVRPDLIQEMHGLVWTLGVIDLTQLVAFQRRILEDAHEPNGSPIVPNDLTSLVPIAFGPVAPIAYRVTERTGDAITIQTENPNLQFRVGSSVEAPLVLHGGSPFLEVAEYRGRWFLRDGYHRAYRLLRAGVSHVPAVLVQARTLAELGPVQLWFFNEEILFSPRPPLVSDFLNDTLTMTYARAKMHKILRVTIVETVEPATTEDSKETMA